MHLLALASNDELVHLFDMHANGALDTRELNGVAHQDGNRHIVALGSNCLAIELNEYIALMDDVTHLRMYGKVLALKLNSVQTNVDEHVQAIDRVKRNSVSRGKNGLDLGVCRRNHARAGRLNRHALAQKAGGKRLVVYLGKRNDIARDGSIQRKDSMLFLMK